MDDDNTLTIDKVSHIYMEFSKECRTTEVADSTVAGAAVEPLAFLYKVKENKNNTDYGLFNLATLNNGEQIKLKNIEQNGFVAYKNNDIHNGIVEFKQGDAHNFVVFVAPTKDNIYNNELILCAFFQNCDKFDELDIIHNKDGDLNKKFNAIKSRLSTYNGVYGIDDENDVINKVLSILIKQVFDTLKSASKDKKPDDKIDMDTLFTGGRHIKSSPRKPKAKAKKLAS